MCHFTAALTIGIFGGRASLFHDCIDHFGQYVQIVLKEISSHVGKGNPIDMCCHVLFVVRHNGIIANIGLSKE